MAGFERVTVPVAVFDVETTGLSPRVDRVVEVAAALVTPSGEVLEEFVSLVNPKRHVGASEVHGITASMVANAPTFDQLAPVLQHFLSRAAAFVGHNVAFDMRMLRSEFARSQVEFPERPQICTMALAGGGRLEYCCGLYGISLQRKEHSALEDVRATASLFAAIIQDSPSELRLLSSLPPISAPAHAPAPVGLLTRQRSMEEASRTPDFVANLLEKATSRGPFEDDDALSIQYAALLERALENRRFSHQEASALTDLAEELGLDGRAVEDVHIRFLDRLLGCYLADNEITEQEESDLKNVARLLGLSSRLQERIAKWRERAPGSDQRLANLSKPIGASSVCFTGEIEHTFRGRRISRPEIEVLAGELGFAVKQAVTKKLDVLVCADPATESGKAKKARAYGIRILHAAEFMLQFEALLELRRDP